MQVWRCFLKAAMITFVCLAPVSSITAADSSLPPLTWEQKSNTCKTLGMMGEKIVQFRSMGMPLTVIMDSLHALNQPAAVEEPLRWLALAIYAMSPAPVDGAEIRREAEVMCFTALK